MSVVTWLIGILVAVNLFGSVSASVGDNTELLEEGSSGFVSVCFVEAKVLVELVEPISVVITLCKVR